MTALQHAPIQTERHLPTFLGTVRKIFSGIGKVIRQTSAAHMCLHEVDRLQSLSDDALAERGLTRDQIVHHVFARVYHY